MHAILPLFACTILLGSNQGAFRSATLDEALLAAQKEKKIVLVDYFTTWCAPCKKLDTTTWKDAQVVAWIQEKCVAVKLDAEKDTKSATKYRITGYPTILLLKADGSEIDRIIGFRDGPTFLSEANDALAGKDSIARAKAKLVGHEQDPMLRKEYAGALANSGRYEEALAEYLWCFDHGAEASRSFSGVRGSFLISDIQRLGTMHPPALKALEERRDAAEARVRAGATGIESLSDALDLNEALHAPERSIALFDAVRAAGPLASVQRTVFVDVLIEPLCRAKRYADVLSLVGDVDAYAKGELVEPYVPRPDAGEVDEAYQASLALASDMTRSKAVTECSRIYEALIVVGRSEDAARLSDRMLTFLPKVFTYTTLIDAAGRAGSVDLAKSIAERGLTSLPEKDKKSIERALRRVSKAK